MITDQARQALAESLKSATPDTVVVQYIALRDKKGAITKQYEEQVGDLDQIMDMLSGFLLDFLATSKQQNGKTINGDTFYKSTRTTASVADGEAFMKFVLAGNLDLIERRANAKCCEDYIAEHKTPVPGVSLSKRTTIGVRRGKTGTTEE